MELHPNAGIDTLDSAGIETGDSPVPPRMRTDRLRFVRAEDTEFDRLHALFSDVADPEEVFELCGWDRHADEDDTRAYLDDRREGWASGERFEYVLADDGEFVGSACLDVREDGSGEFGLWLRKPQWGRGFSAEATDALVHVAFRRLDAPFVAIGCLAANDRSRRAIESFARRYGGAYYGSVPTVREGAGTVRAGESGTDPLTTHHEWVITRERFESGETGLSTLVPGVDYDDLEF